MKIRSANVDPRLAALNILKGVRVRKIPVDEILTEHLAAVEDARDRSLVHELAYGVLRHRSLLDWHLTQNTTNRQLKVPSVVQDILRLGAYQILFCEKIPSYAAVSQSVNLCRQARFPGLCALVNGMLRALGRHTDQTSLPMDYVKRVSVQHSLPEWMILRLLEMWTREETEAFAIASLEVPPLTVRVHSRILSPEVFVQRCRESGVEVESVPWLDEAFIIRSRIPVSQLPAIAEGAFQVQDLGAQMTTLLLDPSPGERVLEVGSAPGGKTTQISERIRPGGTLFAVDSNAHRCKTLQENLERIQANNVQLIIADATRPLRMEPESMDRVLVDVPCSGLGTLRRRVDLKWRLQPEDVACLVQTQRGLLKQAAEYAKPGGVLVYSTCTLLPEENEAIIEEFLVESPEWTIESAEAFLPEPVRCTVLASGGFQTLPHRDGMDGIFGIRLRRKPKSSKE